MLLSPAMQIYKIPVQLVLFPLLSGLVFLIWVASLFGAGPELLKILVEAFSPLRSTGILRQICVDPPAAPSPITFEHQSTIKMLNCDCVHHGRYKTLDRKYTERRREMWRMETEVGPLNGLYTKVYNCFGKVYAEPMNVGMKGAVVDKFYLLIWLL